MWSLYSFVVGVVVAIVVVVVVVIVVVVAVVVDVMDQSKLLWLLTLLSANLQVHFAARQPSCRRVAYHLPIVTAIAAAK